MSVDTPAWVRDAIFYQIFPDRFAASERVHKPGALEPWDAPPTNSRVQGRRPARHRRAPRLPRGPRGQRHLPDADLPVGLQPPLSHVRLLRGRSRCSAATPRCASCSTAPTTAGCGSSSMASSTTPGAGSGRSITSSRPAPRRRTATGSCSMPSVLDGGRPLLAYPPPGTPRSAHGYEAWWGLPALPKLNTDQPRGPRVPAVGSPSTGCASASTAGGSTCRRRSTTRRSGRSSAAAAGRSDPDAYLVGEIWEVAPEWLRGDRFDALMNYPLGEAILGFAGGASARHGRRPPPPRVRREACDRSTARRSPTRLMELAAAYDPDVVAVQLNLLGSHDAPRLRTVLGDDARASGWRRSSR